MVRDGRDADEVCTGSDFENPIGVIEVNVADDVHEHFDDDAVPESPEKV